MAWRPKARTFDRPLRIEERDTIISAGGTGQENDRGWDVVAQPWGRLMPLRALERYTAEQHHAEVVVRYELADEVPTLTHEMRLIDEQDGQCYRITGIVPNVNRWGGQSVDCAVWAD